MRRRQVFCAEVVEDAEKKRAAVKARAWSAGKTKRKNRCYPEPQERVRQGEQRIEQLREQAKHGKATGVLPARNEFGSREVNALQSQIAESPEGLEKAVCCCILSVQNEAQLPGN